MAAGERSPAGNAPTVRNAAPAEFPITAAANRRPARALATTAALCRTVAAERSTAGRARPARPVAVGERPINAAARPRRALQSVPSAGRVPDGCGGTLSCGACSTGETCGGGGVANQCGCTPTTCAALRDNCGTVSNGCGGTLSCGTCPAGQTCGGGGAPNQCGCTPKTCAALGATCGTASDRCGGTLECGSCSTGQTCGGGGMPNQCSAAQTCLPGSSLTTLISGSNVNAYVPVGSWSETGTGILLVPIEGSGIPNTIATAQAVSSCAGNSATGEVLCISNRTDVYVVQGSTLKSTLTSGATSSESFSGGSCETCSVAMDPVHNIAFLSIGYGGVDLGAYQQLNLATNAFSTPISAAFSTSNTTSESLLVDTVRNLVLSPNEAGNFQLLNVSTGTVYNSSFSVSTADSPGEDCTTGIALATNESGGSLTLVDLTQATFSGATWSAPYQSQSIPEFSMFTSGTDGIAIASNSHVGVVAGEFGGTSFGAIVLPATSGSGTPSLTDWVEADIPPTPDAAAWVMGKDPHTLTTYTSPTSMQPYAIFEDDLATRTYVAVVDLNALLARPREAGTHYLATPLGAADTCVGTPGSMSPNPPGCIVRFIKV